MFQRERIAEVTVAQPDGQPPYKSGTGYLIGPKLVLTCAHTLTKAGAGKPGATALVRFRLGTAHTRVVLPRSSAELPGTLDPLASLIPDESSPAVGESIPPNIRPADVHLGAEVVWIRNDGKIDTALLRIVDERWQDPEHLLHIRWGLLAVADPDVLFDGAGFPFARKGPNPADAGSTLRDVEHFSGRLSAGTRQLSHRHELTVLVDHRKRDAERSPWKGLSGAAVFCGPHLTAVVVEDPASEGRHDRLAALPVSELAQIPLFVAEVEQGTGVPFTLEPVGPADVLEDPVQFRTPAGRKKSPGWLLRADAEVVRFLGDGKGCSVISSGGAGGVDSAWPGSSVTVGRARADSRGSWRRGCVSATSGSPGS